jgi:hypothetical protein
MSELDFLALCPSLVLELRAPMPLRGESVEIQFEAGATVIGEVVELGEPARCDGIVRHGVVECKAKRRW